MNDQRESMNAIFVGEVHPVSGGWSLERPFKIPFPDSGALWTVSPQDSRLHVRVTGPWVDDMFTFANDVRSVLQSCVDSLGLLVRASLTCEFTTIIVDGIHVYRPSAFWFERSANTASSESLVPIAAAAASESSVRLALADLRVAMKSPNDTGFLCYRAVESVRQYFADASEPSGSSDKASWEALRSALGVPRSELMRLSALASLRRHGGDRTYTADDRREAMDIAERVVAKFIEYIKGHATYHDSE